MESSNTVAGEIEWDNDEPLQIHVVNNAPGMVNTYSGEIMDRRIIKITSFIAKAIPVNYP